MSRARTATNPHGAGGWDGHPYDASTDRVYLNGIDRPRSDITTCPRCTLKRRYNSREVRNQLCRDCRYVERETAFWDYANQCCDTTMCDDCMAWAEKAAETHKRLQSDRANRRGCWTTREAA